MWAERKKYRVIFSSEIIRKELEISAIQDVRLKYKQNWVNHLGRTDSTRLQKHALNYRPQRKKTPWTTQETMAMSQCRNRSNDLIHGGRWWWWWWWWWWCLDASSPLCFMQIRTGYVHQNPTVFVSVLLGWRHVSATVGHLQVTKMYIEENYTQLMILHCTVFPRYTFFWPEDGPQ